MKRKLGAGVGEGESTGGPVDSSTGVAKEGSLVLFPALHKPAVLWSPSPTISKWKLRVLFVKGHY